MKAGRTQRRIDRMPADKSPVFRKRIVPWYRSKTTCVMIIIVMLGIFLFGLAGLVVSREDGRYHPYAWVPILLMIMSAAIIVAAAVRLARHYTSKPRQGGI